MDKDVKNYSQAESQAREEITALLQRALDKKYNAKLVEIIYAPDSKLGDYTVSCFLLAKKMKSSPVEIAKKIVSDIQPSGMIIAVQATGPYINFKVDQFKFSELVLKEINKQNGKYGFSKIGDGKKVMVEYFSPNTNKPLTIGHVRNICLGQSISNLLDFSDHKVIRSTLYNDRGIAIAKAILAYNKWSNAKKPEDVGMKPDHFVGSFYVKYGQEEKKDKNLEKEASRILEAWEADDKKILAIWQQLMIWVHKGFDQTLKKLGVSKFDEQYYESEYYNEGKKIVDQGLKKGIFLTHPEGYVYAPLERYGLPDKVLLRSNGTSLYITQDLYLATLKNKHKVDHSIYVVGSEQDLQFKQLFKILEMLKMKSLKSFYHLSYGLIRLPDGKIKSREGLAEGTGADELIAKLEILAVDEIKSRFPDLSDKEVSKRAEAIALSALKFYILQVNPKTTMVFDPKKSLAFVGKTGPYLQYTHARINSLLNKAKAKINTKVDYSLLSTPAEFDLVKLLSRFPAVIQFAVENYDPATLANYLYDLAKQFSLFYEQCPILSSDDGLKNARLLLTNDVKVVLAKGLELLDVRPIEKM